MKKEIIQHIINDFELYLNQTQSGDDTRFACGQLIQRLTRVGCV